MMEDLYAKFLPQFVEISRGRLERALEAAGRPDAASLTSVIRELHAIAGEAGLLGQGAIMRQARGAEELAKRIRDASAPEADALVAALQELKQALEIVGASSKPGGGG